MQAPAKPYPNFPLFPSKNGQWRKDVRINGKVKPFYFGPWGDDPRGERAVKEWLIREPGIRAGVDHLRVDSTPTALTLAEMLRRFLTAKQTDYQNNAIAGETFRDYTRECNYLGAWAGADATCKAFTPDYFAAYRRHMETARKLGPDRLATNIHMVRAAFNYAAGQGWIPAPTYGVGFSPPATDEDSKAAAKLRKGELVEELPIWTGPQVEWLLAVAGPVMRAAILLGLNCGMGPSDIAKLRWGNFKGKRLSMRRGKTGVRREGYLWKRTRDALAALRSLPHQRAAIEKDGDNAIVFLNKSGVPIVSRKDYRDAANPDKIKSVKVSASFSATFGKLVKRAKVAGIIPKTAKLTFYHFRHTFYTHAENKADLNALHRATGHVLAGQGKRYKRRPFPLARLKRLAVAVKRAVWPMAKPPTTTGQHTMRIAG